MDAGIHDISMRIRALQSQSWNYTKFSELHDEKIFEKLKLTKNDYLWWDKLNNKSKIALNCKNWITVTENGDESNKHI